MAPLAAFEPEALVADLVRAKVLDAYRSKRALADFRTARPDARLGEALDHLVGEDLLTAYQAERALLGDASGLIVGPYLLLEPLKQGSLGTTFRAVHRGTREPYALKMLPLGSLLRVGEARRHSERLAALPKHPAIVPFAEIETADGSHYLAWPFVEGETLESMLQGFGPRTAAEGRRIMATVAEALAVCHAGGIVHGWLKPANILIGSDRRTRLLDLGLGAILAENIDDDSMLDSMSSAAASPGLMDYSAPEIATDPGTLTPATDAYAFGGVLYHLLTGTPPFPLGNVLDKMNAHRTQPPPPLSGPGVSPAFADCVHRLLAKVPERRPSLAEVAAILGGTTRAGSTSAISTSHPQTEARPPTPHLPAPMPADQEGTIDFNEAPDEDSGLAAETPSNRFSRTKATSPPLPRQGLPEVTPKPHKQSSGWSLPPLPIGLDANSSGSLSKASSQTGLAPPKTPAALGKRGLGDRLAFWKPHRTAVQISVFAPARLEPGQRCVFTFYAHSPEAFASARTLCRAMRADAELVGGGFLTEPIAHGKELVVTLNLANAGVKNSEAKVRWIGQLQPRTFDVFVPWECPPGSMAGVVRVVVEQATVGTLPLECHVLPRSS